MSLESALDEERREVMDILEGRTSQVRASSISQSARTSSPVPPIRSMLDIAPPVRSMLDIAPPVRSMLDVGPTAAPRQGSVSSQGSGTAASPLRSAPLTLGVRSMLDTASPIPPRATQSTTTSPTGSGGSVHRTKSDAASHPTELRPRAGSNRDRNIPSNYQFDMLPTVSGQALPKRVTLGGKKPNLQRNAMAAIMQGQELEPLLREKDRGRHNSTAGILRPQSRSPSSRLGNRSQSPGGSMLNNNSFNLMPTPGKFVTDGGKIIDMSSAYRRLSDANLLKSGGNLSSLPSQTASARARLGSGETLSPTGEVRLQKDYYEDDERAVESSDEGHSSDNDAWGPGSVRGRRRSRKKKGAGSGDADNEDSENDPALKTSQLGMGRSGGPRMAKSLLAAAEEERLTVSSKYKVKSLLEPTVTLTGPAGERLQMKKPGVHPNTNYNSRASGVPSPVTSDSEDLSDIRRAQRLSINMSAIDSSIPHRVIRTIIRGEFSKMQQEAEEGSRRLRTYLVATDLSGEAAYALEWTIGTVLRDGDTLLAIYAVDEEVGTGKSGDTESMNGGLPTMDGSQEMRETSAVVERLTSASQNGPPLPNPSPLSSTAMLPGGVHSRAGSTDSKSTSKADQERFHAIEDISQTCIKFLRKTKLQVRIAVEVIHCKSPKHMLTGAIDGLEPTLVILGSRGRSALKGVLLGSFSNYLVTKSSVPVMVARKKLQKPNAKNKLPHIRLANNLVPTRGLEFAKID